jgi:metallophosphoesterase superfamily enzyme
LSKEHRITLNGLDFIPDLSGALFVPDFKTLLVADLHLEKASNMARRGVHLPPYDTRASLMQLEAVINQSRPAQLIFPTASRRRGAGKNREADLQLRSLERAATVDHGQP